jgi:hypothetical protein
MKIAFLAIVSLCIGCSSYTLTAPTRETLAGAWELTKVNENPLPYVISTVGSNKQEVLEDVLTLDASGTFTDVSTIQTTQNGQTSTRTITDTGTYEFNSYAVTFHFESNGSIGSGTLTGKTMKVVTSGVTFTYRKSR